MRLDITLHDSLDEVWRARAQRQVDFKFAAVRSDIHSLVVELNPRHQDTDVQTIECRMRTKLKNGTALSVETLGMPNTCIADAASRLARSVGRNLAHASVGLARQA